MTGSSALSQLVSSFKKLAQSSQMRLLYYDEHHLNSLARRKLRNRISYLRHSRFETPGRENVASVIPRLAPHSFIYCLPVINILLPSPRGARLSIAPIYQITKMPSSKVQHFLTSLQARKRICLFRDHFPSTETQWNKPRSYPRCDRIYQTPVLLKHRYCRQLFVSTRITICAPVRYELERKTSSLLTP